MRTGGVSGLAVQVVEDAVHDFLHAPAASAAYRSAKRFIFGGECVHLVCTDCAHEAPRGGPDADRTWWRYGECPQGQPYMEPCRCEHGWEKHLFMTFDWKEHRDSIVGSTGLNPEAVRKALT